MKKETVLIVDDLPTNIKVLGSFLNEDYNLLVANNGVKAVALATEKFPDIILMDVMMPEMDGYTACKQLKEITTTKEIPIIFITAKREIEDIIHGFQVGGVDYIGKPFHPEEVVIRVRTHLTIQRQKKELTELNATKDKFFSIIAHDLKNPVNSFKNIFTSYYEVYNALSEEERTELINSLKESADNLYILLEQLLTWARSQRGQIEFKPRMVNLKDIVNTVIATQKVAALNKKINLISEINSDVHLVADSDMLTTVLRNLISNSLKFTKEDGKVTVNCTETNTMVSRLRADEITFKRNNGESKVFSSETIENLQDSFIEISISDTGIGMKEEVMKKLFRIDSTHKGTGTSGEKGTGLGLIMCKEFVEKHGGKIWVESEEGKGSSFKFIIPKS